MGVGDALAGVFGGGNDFASQGQYMLPPTLGRPGASPQDQYRNYAQQNAAFANAKLPQNVLNFSANKQESGQQQGLIDQLVAQGQGYGPNPAMDQLRMTTDQNARSAAGLIGSQHNLNPALAARLASQGLSSANQQAAGQGALMSAQQQLGAQQQAGNMLAQRIGQQSQNAVAQGQAGLGLLGQRQGAQLNYQNMINNAYNNMNNINAGVAAQNAQTYGGYGQGAMAGLSSALQSGAMMLAHGGEVNPFANHVAQKLAGGGTAQGYMAFQGADPMSQFMAPSVSADTVGQSLSMSPDLQKKIQTAFLPKGNIGSLGMTPSLGGPEGESAIGFGKSTAPAWMSHATLGGSAAAPMASLGDFPALAALSEGGKIQGKAKVDADSEVNDNVPALLSPGEVVIPRSAMKSAEDAHDFLDRIIQKNEGPSYKSIMQAKEQFHKMSHGGEMKVCKMCNGGMYG